MRSPTAKTFVSCLRRVHAFTPLDVIKTSDWLSIAIFQTHAAQLLSILARTARGCPFCWAWRPFWENCCCYWSQYRPRLRGCETLCSNETRPNHSRMSKQRARRGCCHQWDQSLLLVSLILHIKNWKQKPATNQPNYGSSTLPEFPQSSILPNGLKRKEGRIDILLLNAGIEPAAGQKLTADGYEPTSVIRSYTVH